MKNIQGQEVKPQTHPIYKKYQESKKLDKEKYWEIHTQFLVPLKIKLNCNDFRQQMQKYSKYFKPWGFNRPELNDVRLGLPLVNLSGSYTDEKDISIGPLDEHNKKFPDQCYLENDFCIPTKILEDEIFNPLIKIKKYMCRSSILHWKYPANFNPHWDVILPTVNLRLWGTDNPSNIELRYKINDELVPCKDVEAGRLYLIETSTVHDARCTKDEAYQFFIALNIDSYDVIKELLDV